MFTTPFPDANAAQPSSQPVETPAVTHRGPCPALKALANDGYLPRNGIVTVDQLVKALNQRLGIAPSIGMLLAKAAMGRLGTTDGTGSRVLDLSDLVQHGFIEHDASLTRQDTRDGNAAAVCPALVDQLLSLSEDGKSLTLDDLATAHQLRMAQSAQGGHRVPFKASLLGTFEAALLFQVLRGADAVDLGDAREFLATEHVPADVAPRKIGWTTLLVTAAKIAIRGNSPSSPARKRAEASARKAPTCPFTGASAPGSATH